MFFKSYCDVLSSKSRLVWDILLPCGWCTLVFGVSENVRTWVVANVILGEHSNVSPM